MTDSRSNNEIVLDAIKHKRNDLRISTELSEDEIKQVIALRQTYGVNLFLLAVKHCKTANIRDIGRLLMRVGGIPPKAKPELKDIIWDAESARLKLDESSYNVAVRLRAAAETVGPQDEDKFLRDGEGKPIYQVWVERTDYDASREVRRALRVWFKRFGPDLLLWAVNRLPPLNVKSENDLIDYFTVLLDSLSSRDIDKINVAAQRFDGHLAVSIEDIPAPCPIRIRKYFYAKTNRRITQPEAWALWPILKEHGKDELIFAICSVPYDEFSVEAVEKMIETTHLNLKK